MKLPDFMKLFTFLLVLCFPNEWFLALLRHHSAREHQLYSPSGKISAAFLPPAPPNCNCSVVKKESLKKGLQLLCYLKHLGHSDAIKLYVLMRGGKKGGHLTAVMVPKLFGKLYHPTTHSI